ncbi:MAG: hypothetical protein QOC86_2775 [Gaiellales bacterium]|nr:hypothetical protein [Gaiellales bacterium]
MSPRVRGLALLAAAALLAVALVTASLARGGLDRGRTDLANPCRPRAALPASGTSGTIERVVLNGLDGAACHLRVSRERLVVGLASTSGRRHLIGSGHAQNARVEEAVRSGLRRAIDDAARRGEIDGLELQLLRTATDHLPIAELMRGVQALS